MKKCKKIIALLLTLMVVTSTIAFAQSSSKQKNKVKSKKSVTLTVSAAASLKDCMEELQKNYKKQNPNVTVHFNFGSSGSLQQQIEQGAQVDMFISAASKQMDALESKNMIVKETRKNLLGNNLVLIAPKGNNNIKDFKSLTGENVKKIAIGEPKSVPVGQYSEEVLSKLGILEDIKSKKVYAKDVREVLTWVETGNVDAGMVYTSDAKISDKVKVVAKASNNLHEPIIYPIAATKCSKNINEDKAFIKYLTTKKAKGIFEKYGFVFLGK